MVAQSIADRALEQLTFLRTRAALVGFPYSNANPQSTRHRPALTTIRRNNHSIRSERWRYIRYRDGTEELYDHERDPLEWTNLAEDGSYKSIKRELAQWLPETNAKDSPSE